MIIDLNVLKSRFRSVDKPTAADWEDFIDTLAVYAATINGEHVMIGTMPIDRIEDGPANQFAATDADGRAHWLDPNLSGALRGKVASAEIAGHVTNNAVRPVVGNNVKDGALVLSKLDPTNASNTSVIRNVAGTATWIPSGVSMSSIEFLPARPIILKSPNHTGGAIFPYGFPTTVNCGWYDVPVDISFDPLDWTGVDVPDLGGFTLAAGEVISAAVVAIALVVDGRADIYTPDTYRLLSKKPAMIGISSAITELLTFGGDAAGDIWGHGSTLFIPTDPTGKFEYTVTHQRGGFGCFTVADVTPTRTDVDDRTPSSWNGGIQMQLIGYVH